MKTTRKPCTPENFLPVRPGRLSGKGNHSLGLVSMGRVFLLPGGGGVPAHFIVATPAFASGHCLKGWEAGHGTRASQILIRGRFPAPRRHACPTWRGRRIVSPRDLGQGPVLGAHHPAAPPPRDRTGTAALP